MPLNDPVPSVAADVLERNVQDFDRFVVGSANTFVTRLGVEKLTVTGIIDTANEAIANIEADGAAAINALRIVNAGSFEDGATLTARNEVLYYLAEQTYYRWDGALPKTVPPASTPASTGGVGDGSWVDVGDAALRSALADPDSDVLVGGRPAKEITDVATAEAFVRLRMKLMAMGRTVLQATDLVSLTLNDPNVDNTAALEALAKRPTARSEIIEFPSGVIYCDEVSLEDFIYWRGRAGTVFKQVAKHIELSNRITNVLNARQKRGYVLESFRIDGNKQNHTVDPSPSVGTANVEGLQTKGSGDFIVANVVSGNTLGDAFDTDDFPITGSGGVFWQCVAKDADKDGFHNSAGSYGNVHIDCVAINCQGVRGGFTQASGSLGGTVFINPTAIKCRFAYGIQATSGEPATLIGAKSYHCESIGEIAGVGLGQSSVDEVFNIPLESFSITSLNTTHGEVLSDYIVEQLFSEPGSNNHIFYVILNELGMNNRITGEFLLYRRTNAVSLPGERARIFIDSATRGNDSIASVYIEQDASGSVAGRGWMDFFTAEYQGKKYLVARLSRRDATGGGDVEAAYQYLAFKGLRDRLNTNALKTFTDTSELSNFTAIEDDTSVSFTLTDGDAKRVSETISRLSEPLKKSTSFVDQRGFDLPGEGSVHVDYEVLYNDFGESIVPHIPLCRIVNSSQVKSKTTGVFYTSRTKVTTATHLDATVTVDAFWDYASSRFVASGFDMGAQSQSEFLVGEINGETWLVLRIPGDKRFVAFSGMRNEDGIQCTVLPASAFSSLATVNNSATPVQLTPVRFISGIESGVIDRSQARHIGYEVLYNDTANNVTPHIPIAKITPQIHGKSKTIGTYYISRFDAAVGADMDVTVNVDAFWDYTDNKFVVSAFESGTETPSEFLVGEINGGAWLVLKVPGDKRFVAFSGIRRDDGVHGKVLSDSDFTSLEPASSSSIDVTLRPIRFLTGIEGLPE